MNAIRTTLIVARNELRIIVKDRGSLAILFVLPLIIASLYGSMNQMYAGLDSAEPGIALNVCLVNADPGEYGAQLARALEGISVLRVESLDSAAAAEERVAAGEASAAILVPADLSERIGAYEPVALRVILDPAEPQAASIITGIMNQVADELRLWGEMQHSVQVVLAESGLAQDLSTEAKGAAEAQTVGSIMTALGALRASPAVSVSTETESGTEVTRGIEVFFALMFPGITVMFVFFIVGMAGASLLAERDAGTLRRLLAAPIPRSSVIRGKALAYTVLVCVQVAVMFGVGRIIFGMPLGRSPLALIVLTVLLGMVASAFGLMIAALSRTPKQADNLGTLLAFLMAGLGGCIAIGPVPATRSAGILRILSRLTPQGNALEGYYSLMAEKASLTAIAPELRALMVFLVIFVGVAAWRFRYE